MAVSLITDLSEVAELQRFSVSAALSTNCTLSSYTVNCSFSSTVSCNIVGATFTVQGVYTFVFDDERWSYRKFNDDTSIITVRYCTSLGTYFELTGYTPDLRRNSSIVINVETSEGSFTAIHSVRNDWSFKRDKLRGRIINGECDVNEQYKGYDTSIEVTVLNPCFLFGEDPYNGSSS